MARFIPKQPVYTMNIIYIEKEKITNLHNVSKQTFSFQF